MLELVVDNFAGGGGASHGIEAALGRPIDIAINHDADAIAMHKANHPLTQHFIKDIWEVDPIEATGGRPVGLGWFSPDCKHFSKAKGGRPVEKRIRGLAWVVVRWAKAVRPRVIMLENVEEFQTWGPLLEDGRPCPLRRGFTFQRWRKQLENLGYRVEIRELRACDYGAPTTRKRLFVIARCDGLPIVWPRPTHGPGRLPYRVAAECIDWSLPCQSIFERQRPLAEMTLRRIARGVMRYVVNNPQPFIVPMTHSGDDRVHGIDEPLRTITTAKRGEFALCAPSLIQRSWGERPGQAPRCMDIQAPLGTIVGGGIKHALVSAFLARHYGGHENDGSQLSIPMHTVTAKDHHSLVTSHLLKLRNNQFGQGMDEPFGTLTAGGGHYGEVRAFLLKYYGTDQDPRLELPLHTLTTKHRFGLVTVAGEEYAIHDIGMRMLMPRELFRAQGFPDSYIIDPIVGGKPLTKTAQVRMVGNSVCPPLSEALVRANFVEAARQEQAA
jgi:DNA (cytosine-5)-methyltransferase 1